MNENLEHHLNTDILPTHRGIMIRRCGAVFSSEEAQRVKVIAELAELYDAYNTIGLDQSVSLVLKHIEGGDFPEACRIYHDLIKDTMASELADVVLSSLTLKLLRGEKEWKRGVPNRNETNTFIRMIRRVADGLEPDGIIDWCAVFAQTHEVDLAVHLRLKLVYNDYRSDWP